MSSKKGDIVALLPGAAGWEIWSGQPAGPFSLVEATSAAAAGDIGSLPAGDVVMFFPARAVTTVPFRAPTADTAMFGDLAALHLERLGLRSDSLAGQLVDTFVVTEREEGADLTAVVLRPPAEGDLPKRGPKEFDVSARAYPLPREGVAMWREFGRWVFALSLGGRMVYTQATTCGAESPDVTVVSDIRLALTQLALQGLRIEAAEVLIWHDGREAPSGAAVEAGFQRNVRVTARPTPVLPVPRSRLLPEDVRAARRVRARKRQRLLLVAAVVLVYAGLAGWLGYGLWRDNQETTRLQTAAKNVGPKAVAYESHRSRWEELGPVVDSSQWPVELLYRVASQLPLTGTVRLKVADITTKEIKLTGESAESAPISQFSLALSRSDLLRDFKWQNPPQEQTNKGIWTFNFSASRGDGTTIRR